MKTAVIYARYSCDKQTEQSIEGQIRVCKEYAEKNNILIVGQYIDQALSGTTDKRPEFRKMLEDSKSKKWNHILVYKLDRFSRDVYDSTIHEYNLKKYGISIISAMENIPETPEGIILKGLIKHMNAYYSAELAQKVKRGMKETRLKGYFQGGKVLYGYKLNGRCIVIDEEESEIVKYIFSQYNAGVFVGDIIAHLNSKNITNRGTRWARTTIYCMLANSKYTGKYMHEDELVDNTYPQIISDEMFEITKIKRTKNKHGSRSLDVNYLLSNKLVCGYCGKPITAESVRNKKGVVYRYYKCSGKKAFRNGCTKSQIKKEQLEDFVMNEVIKKLRHPKIMDSLVKTLITFQKNTDNTKSTLNMLIKEQKQTQLALDNLMLALEKGVINKSTNNRIIELEEKLEKLNNDILVEENKVNLVLTKEDIEAFYDKMLLAEPMLIINYLIKEIKLFDDKMEIKFNSPLKISPVSQGFFFYEKTAKMTFIVPNTKEIITVDFGIEMYI